MNKLILVTKKGKGRFARERDKLPVPFSPQITDLNYRGEQMKSERRKFSPAEELALTTQVEGTCPLCGAALFNIKKSKSYKAYELAHIYPLHPKQSELEELKNEALLHSDVNHPDNLIPLCEGCHGKFDKPRTAEEYRYLATIKRSLIRRAEQQGIQASYQIESDISRVINGLYIDDNTLELLELEYDPKSVADKFNSSMPVPTQQKIKHNVADYYQYIKSKFLQIEQEKPCSSELIYSQIKTYYLKQKSLGLSQQEVFVNIVAWLYVKTKPQTIEAAEIVTSFFIQNCEVFE